MGQAGDLWPESQQPRGYLRAADDVVLRPCLKQEERCQLRLAEDELPMWVSYDVEVAGDDHGLLIGKARNPYFVRVRLPPQVLQTRYLIAMNQ